MKEKIAFLVSVVTSKATIKIGVFESWDEALNFQHEQPGKTIIENINFFPKKRQRKEKQNK